MKSQHREGESDRPRPRKHQILTRCSSAIDKVSKVDDHLKGSQPGRWLLILESELDDRKTLSVFKSGDRKPWDSLGLLRFATLHEELAPTTPANPKTTETEPLTPRGSGSAAGRPARYVAHRAFTADGRVVPSCRSREAVPAGRIRSKRALLQSGDGDCGLTQRLLRALAVGGRAYRVHARLRRESHRRRHLRCPVSW